MHPRLEETIADLDDWQALIGCRGLVVLMDLRMTRDPRSGRPQGLTVTDFNQWVRMGGRPVRAFVAALCDGEPALTAAAGRRLMQACLTRGYVTEVGAACRLAESPVDQLGTLSPVTIVAALAAVLLWHPARPTLRDLLQPPRKRTNPASRPKRRFPWFQSPEQPPEEHASQDTLPRKTS